MFIDEEVRRLERAAADGDEDARRRLDRIRERTRSWATLEVRKLLVHANGGRVVARLSLEDDLRPLFEAVVDDRRRWALAISKSDPLEDGRTMALLARHERGGVVFGATSLNSSSSPDVWTEFTVPLNKICQWEMRAFSARLGLVLIDTLPAGDSNEVALRDPLHAWTNSVDRPWESRGGEGDKIKLTDEEAASVLFDMPTTVLSAGDREAVWKVIHESAASVAQTSGLDEAEADDLARTRAAQRVKHMGFDVGDFAAKREEALRHVDLWIPSILAAFRPQANSR